MGRVLTADDYAGEWRLDRQIVDLTGAQGGSLTGTARFVCVADTRLDYIENGTLTLTNGAVLTAARRYLWVFGASKVQVYFDDGRHFHDFVPQGHAAGTDHPCGEDYYTVRYDFTVWPVWTAAWRVKGPRKDYVSTTRYSR